MPGYGRILVIGGIKMNIEFIGDAYTTDGLKLPMVHFESNEKDICVLCIHGMCGTIIDNYFATVWGKFLAEKDPCKQGEFNPYTQGK